MKTAAIMFDKDGTLIDFDAFWVSVSVRAIEDVLARVGMENTLAPAILEAFGVRDGVTDVNAVLCKGTYAEMGEIVYEILKENGCTRPCGEVVALVLDAYTRHADAGEVKPTCPELRDVLTDLKKRGIKLAVVTTDNEPITRKCLRDLGIEALFDRIYTDDGVTPTKPDPFCARDFARVAGVDAEELVMVGDTMTDIRFAKNAGIRAVSLAAKEGSRAVLSPHADAVIRSMTELAGILE